jgi:tetratricopeptide (TPR) repeat protein
MYDTLKTIAMVAVSLATLYLPPPAAAADAPLPGDQVRVPKEQGSDPLGIERLQEAQRLFPYDANVRRRLGTAFLSRGEVLLQKRDYEGAAKLFEEGRQLYPDEPAFGTMAGIALYLAGRPDLARFQLERARSLPGGETSALFIVLGRVHYDAGDLPRALEVWGEGLAALPDDTTLKALAARARRELAVEEGMATGNSSRFLISYDGSVRSDAAALVLEELETAMKVVGGDLGWYPENPIPVILYTRQDYRRLTDSPEWSGGAYDGKIRLPVAGLKSISPQLRGILRHEYTHAAVQGITRGNAPDWLNEGLAEYEGRREYDAPLVSLQKRIEGGVAALEPPAGDFSALAGDEARLAYETGYSLVRHMVRSYGMHKVRDLLQELGQGKKLAEAFRGAFADLGLTYEEVLAEWRRGLAP